MAKEALIVKTTPLPQSRISFELEIPAEICKTCVNETISSISRFVAEIPDEFKEEIQKKSKTTKSFSLSTAKPKGPEKSHADQIGLQIGDDVNHDMFGDGVIVKLEVTEYEAVATINFVDEGQKTLDLSWAPVRKI